MSTDSFLDDLRLDIRLTDAPHDRTSYVPPWTTTMSMSPRQLLGSTTTMAPSFGPLGTPARLTSGARLIHSPPVWADDTPSLALSLGAETVTRRDLPSASFARAAGVLPGGSWRLPVLVVTRKGT